MNEYNEARLSSIVNSDILTSKIWRDWMFGQIINELENIAGKFGNEMANSIYHLVDDHTTFLYPHEMVNVAHYLKNGGESKYVSGLVEDCFFEQMDFSKPLSVEERIQLEVYQKGFDSTDATAEETVKEKTTSTEVTAEARINEKGVSQAMELSKKITGLKKGLELEYNKYVNDLGLTKETTRQALNIGFHVAIYHCLSDLVEGMDNNDLNELCNIENPIETIAGDLIERINSQMEDEIKNCIGQISYAAQNRQL